MKKAKAVAVDNPNDPDSTHLYEGADQHFYYVSNRDAHAIDTVMVELLAEGAAELVPEEIHKRSGVKITVGAVTAVMRFIMASVPSRVAARKELQKVMDEMVANGELIETDGRYEWAAGMKPKQC
jgi:hypothetical protein